MISTTGSMKAVVVTDVAVTDIADFLGGLPPFDELDAAELAHLVAGSSIQHVAAGALLVAEHDVLDHVWVVWSGSLEVLNRGDVVDVLHSGDSFGHVSHPAQHAPGLVVVAAGPSVCIRIPAPRSVLTDPQPSPLSSVEAASRQRLASAAPNPVRGLVDVMRPAVWCRPDERVGDVARRMGDASCALVRADGPLGIVTDHDFRTRVATGDVGVDAVVADLATTPVLTIDEGASQAAALLQMVEHGVHHLVVTDQAGTPAGVVRVVDLAQLEVRDPLLIRSAIDTATTRDALAEACRALPATLVGLRDSGVSAAHVGAMHSAITDATVRRALALRPSPALAGLRHSWLLLGSMARREPLPRSDIDTALMWADPAPARPADDADAPPPTGPAAPVARDAAEEVDHAAVVRAAAAALLDDLRHCGLTPCPNGANADNPLFSRSQSEWAAAARDWQHDPTREGALLLSAMVADSRPLTDPALGLHLTDTIRSHTRTSQFLRQLLDEALSWHPPTGFVRDFVVMHHGQHRGEFDLKRGGLFPVVALGRWIAIAAGDARGTTPDRLRRGADAGLLTADERDTLIGGFEGVYTMLLDHELAAIRAGEPPSTYINPNDLDSLSRRHLRETFRAIALVQSRIDQEWAHRLG